MIFLYRPVYVEVILLQPLVPHLPTRNPLRTCVVSLFVQLRVVLYYTLERRDHHPPMLATAGSLTPPICPGAYHRDLLSQIG